MEAFEHQLASWVKQEVVVWQNAHYAPELCVDRPHSAHQVDWCEVLVVVVPFLVEVFEELSY